MHSLLRTRPRRLPIKIGRLIQDNVHSRKNNALFSSLDTPYRTAQTLTEKIVQRYSLGLGKDKVVKAGGMHLADSGGHESILTLITCRLRDAFTASLYDSRVSIVFISIYS
jgi:hypothetical protein